jgi:hypothetical protein
MQVFISQSFTRFRSERSRCLEAVSGADSEVTYRPVIDLFDSFNRTGESVNS